MEEYRKMSYNMENEQLKNSSGTKVLNVILKINITIICILLIAVTTLYFIVNDSSRFSDLTIQKKIDSLDYSNLNEMYELKKLNTENEGLNNIVNKKVMDYIISEVSKNNLDYSRISNALNYVKISNDFSENEINKFANSYVCKIKFERNNDENTFKIYYNYSKKDNKEIKIESIIDKSKIDDFRQEVAQKYNIENMNLDVFGLKKNSMVIYDASLKNSVEVKYDDIEDYLVNQVLNSDNITNYYTLFKDAIDPSKPMLALTFDDGPYDLTTERILETLTKYHSKATFFVLGTRVDYYPDTIRKIIAQGSQIGNHTKNHLNLVQQSEATIADEINYTKNRVKEVAGYDVTVMRPPYGNRNDLVKRLAGCPLILWCVDTLDWKTRNAYSVREEILSSAFDGAIILMHDIYESTAQAVEMAVPELINRGYQLVTIDELYYYKGKDKVPGEVVYSIK